jgi:hypothetical protein
MPSGFTAKHDYSLDADVETSGDFAEMWGKFRACSLCWSVTGEPVIEGDALALRSCGQTSRSDATAAPWTATPLRECRTHARCSDLAMGYFTSSTLRVPGAVSTGQTLRPA